MDLSNHQSTQLTNTAINESEVRWTPDGRKITYLAKGQLWEMNPDGSSPKQITDIEDGINGYVYAPDMSKIVFCKDVRLEPTIGDLHPDLPKAKARLINDQFYRHWNDWVEAYTHLLLQITPPLRPSQAEWTLWKEKNGSRPYVPGAEQNN